MANNPSSNPQSYNFNFPQSPFLDTPTGRPSIAWLLWLQNPSFNSAKVANGASGTFTSADGKHITVTNGIITNIV